MYEHELSEAGIRLTAIRLLIWRTLRERLTDAFSLADVQDILFTVDKSTIFRTLTLFADHGLLHSIDDGSGMQKYCVCHCADGHDAHHGQRSEGHRGHVHLTCTRCHKTWCLEDVAIPIVDVPDDFEVIEREYIIKGICQKCKKGL